MSVFCRTEIRARKVLAFLFLTVLSTAQADIPTDISLRNHFGTLTFERPTHVAQLPDRDSTYLVLEQAGNIIAVEWDGTDWVESLFAQLPVLGPAHDNGLLGLAFHPDFSENRKYYVYYTAHPIPGVSTLEERQIDSTQLTDAGLVRTLLSVEQPYYWHAGGTIDFGADDYLYIGLGDGGDPGDPDNRAQDPGTVLGKFLRIDVNSPDAFPEDSTRNYGIPPDNPFIDQEEYLPEIWALGLRNPWKWSFHPGTGEIWAGDVGENTYEKISLVPKGANLGWKVREGAACFPIGESGCPATGFVLPILPLPHDGKPSAVIGGVFFDEPEAAFHDVYIYADYVTGQVYGARFEGGTLVDTAPIATVPAVSTINRDRHGHILAAALNHGVVHVLESPNMLPGSSAILAGFELATRRITLTELLQNRERYILRGLDGRKVEGIPTGVFLVHEKNGAAPPRIFHGGL